jgi:hypothetical protein
MKNISVFILILLLFNFCVSSKKLLENGQYDQAIQQSIQKLRKDPANAKEIGVLERAYNIANKQNTDRIAYLNLEGQPNRWDEVFQIYNQLKGRQDLVSTVMPLKKGGQDYTFPTVDYNKEIVDAKNKAAEYYYSHGKQSMKEKNKLAYQDAFYDFQRVKQYSASYTDVDRLMNECADKGTYYALLIPRNNTEFRLSEDFMRNIITVDLVNLNSNWVQYFNQTNSRNSYDYNIFVNLRLITVSHEKVTPRTYNESKKIQDGYEYELDAKGNVKKDTAGNDIKRPKYKTISCQVIEALQEKIAHIEGVIEYQDNSTNQILKTVPIAADNIFRHISSVASGDKNALSEDTRKRIGVLPMPFPNNWDMIFAAAETLKSSVYSVLRDNKRGVERNFR